jgi:hypothetical protein
MQEAMDLAASPIRRAEVPHGPPPTKLNEPAIASDPTVPLSDSHAEALWRRAVLDLGDTLAGSASHAERITGDGNNMLVASFPVAYSFCRDACDRPETRARLERLLSSAHGAPVRLRLEVHDVEPTAATMPRSATTSRRAKLAEVAELPFVRRAMELFDVPAGQLRYAPPEGEG